MYERFISSSMLTGIFDAASIRIGYRATGTASLLHIQVLHVERVVLDELSSRLDLIAHQRREHLVGLGMVLGTDLQQRSRLGFHGRRPELLGVHFAEALV